MLDYSKIIKDDHPNLRLKSTDVSLPLSEEDLNTLKLMNQYLVHSLDEEFCDANNIRPGIGLAAPQINIQKRMFTVLFEDEKGIKHHYGVINPKIISHSEELTFLPFGEGCLSVDYNVEGLIHRPKRITVRAHFYDYKSETLIENTIRLRDYAAVVFQHEYDHLDGVLFYDHINEENPFNIPANSKAIGIIKNEE